MEFFDLSIDTDLIGTAYQRINTGSGCELPDVVVKPAGNAANSGVLVKGLFITPKGPCESSVEHNRATLNTAAPAVKNTGFMRFKK